MKASYAVGLSLAWWHFRCSMIELAKAISQLIAPHYEQANLTPEHAESGNAPLVNS